MYQGGEIEDQNHHLRMPHHNLIERQSHATDEKEK